MAFSDLAEVDPPTPVSLGANAEVSFIPMADVSESGRWTERATRPLQDVQAGYTPFRDGDVLFAKITPCTENGKGAHAVDLANGFGFGSTEFYVLRARPGTDPRWLYHWSLAPRLRLSAESFMIGSAGQQRVRADFFDNFRVPALPLPQQRVIADILDTLDDAIRKTEEIIAKLQQAKQGLLHDLLTRGIDEDGELRDPERHPEQFKETELGRVPRGWGVWSLQDLLSEYGGFAQTGPFGSQLHADEYVSKGVPVVMPQDIDSGRVILDDIARIRDRKAIELARHRLRVNDVVFARRGDISRCAPVTHREQGWLCGTGCLLARVPEAAMRADWLTSFYGSDAGQRQVLAKAVGSTMVNLNTSIILDLLVPIPTRREQDRIASVMGELGLSERAERESLGKLRLSRSGLMDDLLTGRVRVSEAEEALA